MQSNDAIHTESIRALNRSGFRIVGTQGDEFIQSGAISSNTVHSQELGAVLFFNDIACEILPVHDNSDPINYMVQIPKIEAEKLKAIGIHWDNDYKGTDPQTIDDVKEGISNEKHKVKIINEINKYQVPFGSREFFDNLIKKVSPKGRYSITDFEKYVRNFDAELVNQEKLDELAKIFLLPPMLKSKADLVAQIYDVPEEMMNRYYNRYLEILETKVDSNVHSPAEAMYIRQMQRIAQRASDLGYFKSTAGVAPDDSKWAKAIREQQEKNKEGGGSITP